MVSTKTENKSSVRETETDRLLRKLSTFNELGKALTSSLNIDEILNVVVKKIQELLEPKNWSLLLVNAETGELTFRVVVGEGAEKILGTTLNAGEGIAGWVAKKQKPLLVHDVSKDDRFSPRVDRLTKFDTHSVVCVPLVARGNCHGVIELINNFEESSFSDEDLLLLTTMGDYTAIALENAVFIKKVEELTITDDLTGLYNSRFLQGRIDYEVNRASRFKTDLSMIFLDLDLFKHVNDKHGHLMGSQMLKEVAELLIHNTRNIDMVCRYGGDEFVILMPETSKKNALLVANKLRNAVKKNIFLKDAGLDYRLTSSFGVASYPGDANSKDELIELADSAMYRIKNKARDGVAEA
jgi:diguanylate cyclase (GGDEF)-like protein